MDEKTAFIVECLRRELPMTALCERDGISRDTGYRWLGRYLEEGPHRGDVHQPVLMDPHINKSTERGDVRHNTFENHAGLQILELFHSLAKAGRLESRARITSGLFEFCQNEPNVFSETPTEAFYGSGRQAPLLAIASRFSRTKTRYRVRFIYRNYLWAARLVAVIGPFAVDPLARALIEIPCFKTARTSQVTVEGRAVPGQRRAPVT
jgi:hypothetical protein